MTLTHNALRRLLLVPLLLLSTAALAQTEASPAAADPAATVAEGGDPNAAADEEPDPNAESKAAKKAKEAAAEAAAKALQKQQRRISYWIPRATLALLVAAVLLGIWFAHRGHVLPLRDIPGLLVFEEAVSRATEMGRPTMFTCGGASDLKRVQLFASMPLLRRVSELSGTLGNRLIVPVCYPEAMPVHINAIKDGYADAGTVEAFHADDVRFFPGGQFFFAIGAMGWMMRERPATCFYFGYWEADSLLFAETGQTINAMQIAGTDQPYQIPFFIAACDYTLIGEEFWAASAKISREPHLLGSLGAQDLFKLGVLALIILGSLLAAWGPFKEAVTFVQEALR